MDDYEIREVPHEPNVSDTEPLQESVVEVAAGAAAVFAGAQAFGTFVQAHYSRLTYELAAEQAERERAAQAAELAELRRSMDAENRYLRAQLYGLSALDAEDGTDDYFGGFRVED